MSASGIWVDSFDTGNEVLPNPIADWSVVFVPYCDGSVFSGDADFDDDCDGQTDRYQRGLKNLSAGLDVTASTFPSPSRILLPGISAGGFGTDFLSKMTRPDDPDRVASYGDLADAMGGRLLRHRDLVIDLDRRRVQRGEKRISLTATEFEILRHLASKPGRVFTRRELLELVRDYEALDQDEKTINVHVSHLREKLEDDPVDPTFILTIRGAGYAFAER